MNGAQQWNIEHLLDERKRLRFLHQERIRFKVTTQLDRLADVGEARSASLILESLSPTSTNVTFPEHHGW